MSKEIVFLLSNKGYILDFSGPMQVFESANSLSGKKLYTFKFISTSDINQVSLGSTKIVCDDNIYSWQPVKSNTLVIPGGDNCTKEAGENEIIAWVKKYSGKFDRVASICTASFILAKAGLLNNKPATTHWFYVNELREKFPDIEVFNNCSYTEDNQGKLFTSAGVSKGIDLALFLLEKDIDISFSNDVARHIMFTPEPRIYDQYAIPIDYSKLSERMKFILQYIDDNLSTLVNVDSICDNVGLSRRQLSRVFKSELNMSPANYVEYSRFKLSDYKLRFTSMSLLEVSNVAGYSDLNSMRRSIRKRTGLSPSEYRQLYKP
ncbi:GlxA family transcriptional regulator [Oceanospirillum sediminis]|uniref:DJ-1/PfpI family protein n=1 Tax=Oceanospirillum sediminis TaxID=2760088 RepID=A0A839IYN9_9GAMM|nr:helix-turn-helix domain-containing protein [Oceanospirillum sediminis]MBB1489549.1 DJ-1/PfpI family protein [Oceanospirillum sediminis]